jgi:hypothetical protein
MLKEGVSNMPKVKCNVSNCTYWGQGNNCMADAILVEIDAHSNSVGMSNHQDTAGQSAETCCHTFQSKE